MTIFRADSAIQRHKKIDELGRKFGNKTKEKKSIHYQKLEALKKVLVHTTGNIKLAKKLFKQREVPVEDLLGIIILPSKIGILRLF